MPAVEFAEAVEILKKKTPKRGPDRNTAREALKAAGREGIAQAQLHKLIGRALDKHDELPVFEAAR